VNAHYCRYPHPSGVTRAATTPKLALQISNGCGSKTAYHHQHHFLYAGRRWPLDARTSTSTGPVSFRIDPGSSCNVITIDDLCSGNVCGSSNDFRSLLRPFSLQTTRHGQRGTFHFIHLLEIVATCMASIEHVYTSRNPSLGFIKE
jgi:hypothetical protein